METLNVTIITPESREEAISATSLIVPLQDGYWGILPKHMNMVAVLASGKITAKTTSGVVHFKIPEGWIEIFHDRVIILTPDFQRIEE